MSIVTSALNLVEAKAAAQKLAANIAKRSKRLQSLELVTNAVVDFEKLKMQETPKTREEWVARAKQLDKLNQSPGLRVASAPLVVQREAKVAARQERRNLAARAKDPVQARSMTKRQLEDVLQFQLQSLRAKRAGVMKQFGMTHAVVKFDEVLAELQGKKAPLDRAQLSHYVSRLNGVDKYEGMSVGGARTQQARGIQFFGDKYKDWNPKQAAAVWDQVHATMASDESLGSTVALDMVRQYLEDDAIAVTFISHDSAGHELESPKVEFGFTQQEAQAKAAKRRAMDREVQRHKENSLNVIGDQKPLKF